MKVFISWSGERSKELANALRDWIPLVLQYVEPFVSDKDIAAGDRWAQAIAGELENSNFGIICITPENINSEWILFESGALSKSMLDGKVIPLLFGLELSDLSGPLSQFQAQKVEEEGIKEVIRSINNVSDTKASEQVFEKLIPALWPQFQELLEKIPDKRTPGKHLRPQHEILEELVAGIRGINSRFNEIELDKPEFQRVGVRRKPRFHPKALNEIMYFSSEVRDSPIFLLLIAGIVRVELPIFADLISESYRELRDAPNNKVEQISHRLSWTVKNLTKNPAFWDTISYSERAEFFLDELHFVLDKGLNRWISIVLNKAENESSETENKNN